MKKILLIAAAAIIGCVQIDAQNVTIKGVAHNNRYDDGDQMVNKSTYVGWMPATQDPAGVGKAIFAQKQGIYEMSLSGATPIAAAQNPSFAISEYYSGGQFTDVEKALTVNSWNMMYGNSGALYANGKIYTVFNRDEQSSEPEDMFIVRQWDAATGKMEKEFPHYGETKVLESAGLAFNPKDNKVYGLFYVTNAQLPEDITSDPEYFTDEDDRDFGREGMDAGYALGVLNTETMEVQLITKGLFYYNFVTFAINSRGEAYALTSGAVSAPEGDAEGHLYDINNNLTGAQLYQFNLETGNIYMKEATATDTQTGETYTTYVPLTGATGYASQYRRQSACFAKSNPDKMYWNGYFNSGKGINEGGSWTSLSDKEWKTNGKFDTCLYEVDITTGKATRLGKIKDRYTFSCMWVDGDDNSDGQDIVNGIAEVKGQQSTANNSAIYDLQGRRMNSQFSILNSQLPKGLYIMNGKKFVVK